MGELKGLEERKKVRGWEGEELTRSEEQDGGEYDESGERAEETGGKCRKRGMVTGKRGEKSAGRT